MMLDLQQLCYFVAVAETENVGQAAQLLHISQSPLSRQIRQLEERLGMTLFERDKKRLRLNRTGRAFLVEAQALIAHATRVQQQAHDMAAGHGGTLVVGYVAGAMHAGALAESLRRFRARSPDVRLQLLSLCSADQFAALKHNDIDIAYAYSEPLSDHAVRSVIVADEPFMLASPESVDPIEVERQHDVAFIAPQSWKAREEMRQAFAEMGWAIDICAEAADPVAALSLVQAGLGMALVQASLACVAPPGVRLQALPDRFPMRMRVYCMSAATPSALAQRWMDTLSCSPTAHSASAASTSFAIDSGVSVGA
jgi:DNA-binding transcriptional LysR family regulator